jgi:hypothetical protein
MKIYPVVSVGTKPSLVHIVEALEYCIPITKSLPELFLTRHEGLATKALAKFPVTLMPLSTKELLHEGWGSPRPPHKAVVAAPHQAGGSMTCWRATKTPRGRHTEIQLVVHSRNSTRSQHLAFTLSLELA